MHLLNFMCFFCLKFFHVVALHLILTNVCVKVVMAVWINCKLAKGCKIQHSLSVCERERITVNCRMVMI